MTTSYPKITILNSASIFDTRLSDTAFRALAYQSCRANHSEDHIAFPSIATAAEDLNRSENCVRNSFHTAVELGYSSVVGYTPGGVRIYSIHYPDAAVDPSSTTMETPTPPPWGHNREENKEEKTTTTADAGVVVFSGEEKADTPLLAESKASWCPQITCSQGQEIDALLKALPEQCREQVRAKIAKALASKRIANPVEYAKVAVTNKNQDLERFAASKPEQVKQEVPASAPQYPHCTHDECVIIDAHLNGLPDHLRDPVKAGIIAAFKSKADIANRIGYAISIIKDAKAKGIFYSAAAEEEAMAKANMEAQKEQVKIEAEALDKARAEDDIVEAAIKNVEPFRLEFLRQKCIQLLKDSKKFMYEQFKAKDFQSFGFEKYFRSFLRLELMPGVT